jgi:tRNA(fMet)-specific endonuclease VapC
VTYLLDSDWIIDVLGGHEPAVSTLRRLQGSRTAISWVSVAEVYDGAFSSSNPRLRLVNVRQFVSRYHVIGIDDAIAERFAQERANLRHRGELIGDLDLFIAATALVYDLTLLSFNRRHFERVPDLKLYRLT